MENNKELASDLWDGVSLDEMTDEILEQSIVLVPETKYDTTSW